MTFLIELVGGAEDGARLHLEDLPAQVTIAAHVALRSQCRQGRPVVFLRDTLELEVLAASERGELPVPYRMLPAGTT